jgi:hypothetical protein
MSRWPIKTSSRYEKTPTNVPIFTAAKGEYTKSP